MYAFFIFKEKFILRRNLLRLLQIHKVTNITHDKSTPITLFQDTEMDSKADLREPDTNDLSVLKYSVMSCTKQNAYAWACMESIVSQYKRSTLNRFETLVSGLTLVIIIYIGMYIGSLAHGWASNLSGECLVLVCIWTILIGGFYTMFPIITYGAQANMCVDLCIKQGRNIAWYCGLQDNDALQSASDAWTMVADRHESNKNIMTVLMIPVTPGLLKSIAAVILSTLGSAIVMQMRDITGVGFEL